MSSPETEQTAEERLAWLGEDTFTARAWQDVENARAIEHLRAPGDVSAASAVPHVAPPQQFGSRWFRRGPDGAVELAAALDGPWEPLVDGGRLVLDWFVPSPDGSYVAYGLSEGGWGQSVLHVVDVGARSVLPVRIPYASEGHVAWLPDGSGFFYVRGEGPDTGARARRVRFHRLGGPGREIEPLEVDPSPSVQVSPNGRWALAIGCFMDPRPLYVRCLEDDEAGWQPALSVSAGSCRGTFVGDEYVAVTDEGADRGRLVSILMPSFADRSTWRELCPEGAGVMRHVTLVGDRLVLVDLVDCLSRVRVLTLDGEIESEVPLPGEGTVSVRTGWWGHGPGEPLVAASANGFAFVFCDFCGSPGLYWWDVHKRRLDALVAWRPRADRVAEARACTSNDGATVTYTTVGRADLDRDEPRPALVYAYGAANNALLPGALGPLERLVDAGGIVAFANVRGGGEHGTRWWQEGRLERKQQSIDDLHVVAEHLCAEAVTTPDQLAIAGMSAGGLLTSAAAVQRPELFRAVIALVPLTDMLAYDRDPWAREILPLEYGHPSDAQGARALRAYSPLHNVVDGRSYPAMLVGCASDDYLCPSWHGRKLVARLQEATAGDAPILLRVWSGVGHDLADAAVQDEWVSFALRQLGLADVGKAA